MPPSPRLALLHSLPEAISARLMSAAQLGPQARCRPLLLPTAIPTLDQLLGGGLPRGGLVEITGRPRFTLGLISLAAATSAGESAALVDPGNHLDPQAAVAVGVDLARLLWLRPHGLKDAFACAETVLDTGFALVVLDLGIRSLEGSRSRRSPRAPEAAWVRLARAAAAHETALLVLSPTRTSGAAATAVLAAEEAHARWLSRAPSRPLLLGLSARLSLEKRRGQRPGASGAVNLRLLDTPPSTPQLAATFHPSTPAAALSFPGNPALGSATFPGNPRPGFPHPSSPSAPAAARPTFPENPRAGFPHPSAHPLTLSALATFGRRRAGGCR